MTVSGTNFGKAAEDYGTFRAGFPDSIFDRLAEFNIQMFSYDLDVPYTPEAWRGRIRASAGVAALDEDSARRFDTDHSELLATRFPASVFAIPHRVFAIVAEALEEL